MVEVLKVWPLEGKLIEAFTKHAAGADQRRILQVHIYARNRGKFAAQLLDDFIDMRAAGARVGVDELLVAGGHYSKLHALQFGDASDAGYSPESSANFERRAGSLTADASKFGNGLVS